MTAEKNRQIVLASRPRGELTLDNFKLVEADIPEPGLGQMLLCTIYLSLDPYMRGRMNAGLSYAKPVEVGEIMEGGTVCDIASRSRTRHSSWERHQEQSARWWGRSPRSRVAASRTGMFKAIRCVA